MDVQRIKKVKVSQYDPGPFFGTLLVLYLVANFSTRGLFTYACLVLFFTSKSHILHGPESYLIQPSIIIGLLDY